MKKIDHEHKFDGKQDRNFYQKPFDDVTDPLPQIDEASASMAEKDSGTTNANENAENPAQTDKQAHNRSEINEDDVRDMSDSMRDWNAEHNRTGRQK